MPAPQHLAFPMRLTSGGNLATVEQDSDAEIANSIAIALSFPRGSRRGSPRYGAAPSPFETAPLDLARVRAEVSESERRAAYDVTVSDEFLREAIARVQVGFDPKRRA